MLKDFVINSIRNANIPSILVFGDLMLDHYIFGSATRLSPEAPVPIVHVKEERNSLGGAANLALNLRSLGANVMLSGTIGHDQTGDQILSLVEQAGIDGKCIIRDQNRPSTLKSRILAGTHQLLRLDREETTALHSAISNHLLELISNAIPKCELLLISDYQKGSVGETLAQQLISKANRLGKKVMIDPKGVDYRKYKGAYIIKPNRKELKEATHVSSVQSLDDVHNAAQKLIALTEAAFILTTLSEDGLALTSLEKTEHFPVKANEVFDVTGAGDTVLATLAYFTAIGLPLVDACELANLAAAIVVKRVGSSTVSVEDMLKNIG